MALLQGIKKLFSPLLDDLDCVSAVKDKQTLSNPLIRFVGVNFCY
jgi:hypothetical protein